MSQPPPPWSPPPPASQRPLPSPPPPPVRAHPVRPRGSCLVSLVGSLVVLILAGGIGSAVIYNGNRQTRDAQATFQMPYTKNVRSAEFRVVGPTYVGSGVIEFAPEHAFSETMSDLSGHVFQREVQVGGVAYSLGSDSHYHALGSALNEFAFLGWDGGPPGNVQVAGQTRLAGQQAWVLRDTYSTPSTSDKWVVAKRTGDPLEAVINGDTTYTFSDWGRAPAIRAPAAGEIATQRYSGSGTVPVVGPAAAVRVVKVKPGSGSGDPAGFRTVAVKISFQNRASAASDAANYVSLVSPDGVFGDFNDDPNLSSRLPQTSVAPGQTITGWDEFIVPRQATSFHLLLGDDTLDYLISISVRIPG